MSAVPKITLTALSIALSLFPFSTSAQTMTDVWLDVDVAAGLHEKDVDDALALIQAFHSPELKVRGVSAVYGNAPLDDGWPIANEIVYKFGPPNLDVQRGAAGAEDLGQTNDAVEAMARALRERSMTIIALGPLTNVGTLLQKYPQLHARIDRIVIVAGRRPEQRFTYPTAGGQSFRDFNFENDPKAMQVLLDSKVPLVYAPWEVSSHLWLTQEDLDALNGMGDSGKWIAKRSQNWLDMWLRRFKTPGFNPFDTLALAYVTHPELIEHFEARSWIEEGPDDTYRNGNAPNKPYLLIDPERSVGREIVYCHRPKDAFKPILVGRLGTSK